VSYVPVPEDWPASQARTIVVFPPNDGYKKPVGFGDWPQEQQKPKRKRKKGHGREKR